MLLLLRSKQLLLCVSACVGETLSAMLAAEAGTQNWIAGCCLCWIQNRSSSSYESLYTERHVYRKSVADEGTCKVCPGNNERGRKLIYMWGCVVRVSWRKGLRHREPALEPRLRDLWKHCVVLPCTCSYSDGSHACFQNV